MAKAPKKPTKDEIVAKLKKVGKQLQTSINALGDLSKPDPDGKTAGPYVADAQSFATQAGVCVRKQLETMGVDVDA